MLTRNAPPFSRDRKFMESARGTLWAKAIVTERLKPFVILGQTVHQVGIPWHYGWTWPKQGGDSANLLTPSVGDPNTGIPETKAFMENTKGALVTSVIDGQPAGKAGIKTGDVITAVAGEKIDNANELLRRVAALRPGESAELTLLRKNSPLTVSVTLGERDAKKLAQNAPDQNGDEEEGAAEKTTTVIGLSLRDVTAREAKALGMTDRRLPFSVKPVKPRIPRTSVTCLTSCSSTSSPAPPKWPLVSATTKSASFTRPPRAVLINIAPGFI